MFTIVIPTMWRKIDSTKDIDESVFRLYSNGEREEDPLQKMLSLYDNHPLVDDIIIIDNDFANRPQWFSNETWNNVRIFNFGKNIYVNPSWNFGVQNAKNDKICIVNDDLWFDINLLDFIHDKVQENLGSIGLDSSCFNYATNNLSSENIKNIYYNKVEDSYLVGYGCCIFIHKSNFKPIPENILVWFGDDWIVKTHLDLKKIPRVLVDYRILTNSASTSADKQFTPIKENDGKVFSSVLGEHWCDYVERSIKKIEEVSMSDDNNYQFNTDSTDLHVLAEAVYITKNLPGATCEIGLREGGGSWHIMEALIENKLNKTKLHLAIDPYGNIPFDVGVNVPFSWSPGWYTNKMRNETLSKIYSYVEHNDLNFQFFNLESSEFMKRYADGIPFYNGSVNKETQYSLVHFDGNRKYASVLDEIMFFHQRTPIGAVFVFDDLEKQFNQQTFLMSELNRVLKNLGWFLCIESQRKVAYVKKSI